MPILVNSASRLLFQGTGESSEIAFYLQQMIAYKTKIVAGVGIDSRNYMGIPFFDSVQDAVRFSSCNVSIIFSEAMYAADSILEAIEAEIPLIICVTDNIPLHDLVEVKKALLESKKSRLIGPGSSGIITPGESKIGIMPGYPYERGSIGIISRSGTLSYIAAGQITALGFGQSTHVVLGNRTIGENSWVDMLTLFEQDSETSAILLVWEVDDPEEEKTAAWIKKYVKKPIGAYIAGGIKNPFQKEASMRQNAKKSSLLSDAGVYITENPAMMGSIVATAIEKKRIK